MACRPVLHCREQRSRSRGVVLALEEPERRDALAPQLVVTAIDDGGDPSDDVAPTGSDEQARLGMVEEGVLRREHLPDIAAQGSDPARIVAVDGVGNLEKAVHADAVGEEGLDVDTPG
jgi:hypothetical protein